MTALRRIFTLLVVCCASQAVQAQAVQTQAVRPSPKPTAPTPPSSTSATATTPQPAQQTPDSATLAEARYYALKAIEEGQKKNYRKSEEFFTKAISFVPDGDLYIRRGITRYYLNNDIAMLEDMSAAVSVCPACAAQTLKYGEANEMKELMTAIGHGMIYFSAGYFPKAASLLEQAQKLGSTSPTVEFLLGMSRIIAGNPREGCANCERAASVGNPLVYGMRYVSDTLAKYCGVKIPRDLAFQRRYHEMDSVSFATNKIEVKPGFPRPRQLYPRGANDSATIEVAGQLRLTGYDSAYVEVFKNGALVYRAAQPLQYFMAIGVKDTTIFADFAFAPSIHAELSEYKIRLVAKSLARREDRTLVTSDSVVCGDIFAVCGQSNSVLGRVPRSVKGEFMRTFVGSINGSAWTTSETTNNRYLFPSPAGNIHNRVGGIGGAVQQALVERLGVPICLMQVSSQDIARIADYLPSGQSLGGAALTNAYEQLVLRLAEAKVKDAVKGIIWYQGESDSSNGYADRFKTLRDSWRSDMPSLRRIYIVQPRPSNCGNAINSSQAAVREAQRMAARLYPDVSIFAASANVGLHDGCHYDDTAYTQLGERLARLVAKDFYAKEISTKEISTKDGAAKDLSAPSDTNDLFSPMPERAVLNDAKTELVIEFSPANTTLGATADTMLAGKIHRLVEAFSAVVKLGKKEVEKTDVFKSVSVSGNRVTLALKQPSAIQSVSYLPAQFYPDTKPAVVYEGPWLVTKRGVGAVSFYRLPVESTTISQPARTSKKE
jgi:tetratricopeptide (TPR) repeat protein